MIKSDDKKRARLNCMRYFLHQLDYPGKNQKTVHQPDPLIVAHPPFVANQEEC
jgi:hypothetical protein